MKQTDSYIQKKKQYKKHRVNKIENKHIKQENKHTKNIKQRKSSNQKIKKKEANNNDARYCTEPT